MNRITSQGEFRNSCVKNQDGRLITANFDTWPIPSAAPASVPNSIANIEIRM